MNGGTEPIGATPGEDTSGLLLTSLTTREERNAAEAEAISVAYNKYIFEARKQRRGTEWLHDTLIRAVHKDMFGSIWEWGGSYRLVRLNIGVEPHQIREQIQQLCGDFTQWDSGSMPILEVAARLQHRLAWVHPFKNGNGRHARLITDMFLYSCDSPLPEWPQIQLMSQGDKVRQRYIDAMKGADQGNFSELMVFISTYIPQSDSHTDNKSLP